MRITVETFEPEHFAALERGLSVARDAYKARCAEIEELEDKLAYAERDLELEENERSRDWSGLIEFIEDVGRGVRTVPELLAYVEGLG